MRSTVCDREVTGGHAAQDDGSHPRGPAGVPEDNLRREIIDGELIVTAAPSTRHQEVVLEIPGFLISLDDLLGPPED